MKKKKVFQTLMIAALAGSLMLDAHSFSGRFVPGYEYYQKTLNETYYNAMKDDVESSMYAALCDKSTIGQDEITTSKKAELTTKLSDQINYTFSQIAFTITDEAVTSDISESDWKKLDKQVEQIVSEYFDQDIAENVADAAINVAKNTYSSAIDDLNSQIQEKTDETEALDTAISTTKESLETVSAQLAAETDNSDSTSDQIKDLKSQLDDLTDKKNAITSEKNNLLNYPEYKSRSLTVTDYSSSIANIDSSYQDLYNKSNDLYTAIENKFKEYKTENGRIPESVIKAYTEFKEKNDQTLNSLQVSCDVLKNTSMDKADPNNLYQEESNELETLFSTLSDNSFVNGTYANNNDENIAETAATTEGTQEYTLTDDQYEELKNSIDQLQTELDSFQKKYGNALNDVADAVNAVTTVFDAMADGGIYDSYTKELSQLSSALCSEMQEFGGIEKNEDVQAFINGVTGEIADYQSYSDNSLNSIQGSIDNAVTEITPVIDTSNYNTYQNYIAEQVDTATTSLASLKTSIETEAAERKTMDEKLSKSIGQINETLMGILGTTSINKIADGTVTGAIGNTSIAGIGDGTLSGAISALNNNIISKNTIKDSNNGQNITFSYSKGGMAYNNYSYLAAWNGYELRPVDKNQYVSNQNFASKFMVKSYSKSWSSHNSYGSHISAQLWNNFNLSGYTAIGIVGATTGNTSGYFYDLSLSSVRIAVSHVSGLPDKANIDGTATVNVLYIKN